MCDGLIQHLQRAWLQEYQDSHCGLGQRNIVYPMTRKQIISAASNLGIEVMDVTFDRMYRNYHSDVGLLGNACQYLSCSYFLRPDESYNQHAYVERDGKFGKFLHPFHHVAYEHRNSDMSTIISEVARKNSLLPEEIEEKSVDHLNILTSIYRLKFIR